MSLSVTPEIDDVKVLKNMQLKKVNDSKWNITTDQNIFMSSSKKLFCRCRSRRRWNAGFHINNPILF